MTEVEQEAEKTAAISRYETHIKHLTPALPGELSGHKDLWCSLNKFLDRSTDMANVKITQSWSYIMWRIFPVILLIIAFVISLHDIYRGWSVVCVVYICVYREDATLKKMFETYQADQEHRITSEFLHSKIEDLNRVTFGGNRVVHFEPDSGVIVINTCLTAAR